MVSRLAVNLGCRSNVWADGLSFRNARNLAGRLPRTIQSNANVNAASAAFVYSLTCCGVLVEFTDGSVDDFAGEFALLVVEVAVFYRGDVPR